MFEHELVDHYVEQSIMEAEHVNPHELEPTPVHSNYWEASLALAQEATEKFNELINLCLRCEKNFICRKQCGPYKKIAKEV